jgi:hypothetical protein
MDLRLSAGKARPKAKGTSRQSQARKAPTKAKPKAKARSKPPNSARAKATPKPSARVKAKAPSKPPASVKPKAKAATKTHPGANEAKSVKLLSGGNPQIAKADGDAPVQAYIAGMPGWKGDVGRRLDALIVRNVPDVRKAVKWNSPFYGIEGQGWFLGVHTFTNYVKVAFFRGTSLRPVPPGSSKSPDTRYIDIHEGELDEAQMAEWVKQAAVLPGWVP